MVGATLEKVTGLFERRWLVAAFFPVLVFWSLLATVVLGTVGDLPGTLRALGEQHLTITALQAVGFLIGVTFTSMVLSGLQLNILQLYEGYWPSGPADWLAENGRRWHRGRLQALNGTVPEQYAEMYYMYPPKASMAWVMPTRIGNVLRAMEVYPWVRYGIDAVVLWPRLFPLLPERVASSVSDARTALDSAVAVASLASAFAVAMGVYLLLVNADWWLYLACVGGGSLVAFLAYQAAVANAVSYAEQVKTCFDLYRSEVPKQMRMAPPAAYSEEKAYWTELGKLLYRAGRENANWAMWSYVAGADNAPAKPETTKPLPGADPKPSLWRRIVDFVAGQPAAAVAVSNPPQAHAPPVALAVVAVGGGFSMGRRLLIIAVFATLVGSILLIVLNGQAVSPVPVPVRELTAYRLIDPSDLTARPMPVRAIPSLVARSASELTGRYPLDALPAASPVPVERLGPVVSPTQLTRTVAVGIAGTPALLLGGTLRAGDHVDLTVVPTPTAGQTPTPITFADVLVLDVRQLTIVVALPADRISEYIRVVPSAMLVLTRHTS